MIGMLGGCLGGRGRGKVQKEIYAEILLLNDCPGGVFRAQNFELKECYSKIPVLVGSCVIFIRN